MSIQELLSDTLKMTIVLFVMWKLLKIIINLSFSKNKKRTDKYIKYRLLNFLCIVVAMCFLFLIIEFTIQKEYDRALIALILFAAYSFVYIMLVEKIDLRKKTWRIT